MHIYFIGQRGISAENIKDYAEIRTQALVDEMAKNGHTVTVATTPSYTKQRKLRSYTVELLHFPSLNPNIAGGFIYTILSCIKALSIKPDTIHVQGWTGGMLIRILVPFMPKTALIWTISTFPENPNFFLRFVLRKFLPYIASGFDSICTPSRMVQYRLLTAYSLKSEYIPDGYSLPVLPDIRAALFGLRKEQYGVVITEDIAQLKQIIATYKALKSKKKLVVFTSQKYPGVTSIDLPLLSRGAQSIVRQAGFVISADPSYSPIFLQAMDSGRAIIATTHPLNEELFGTTASYYEKNDSTQLQNLLRKAIQKHSVNIAAQLRAKNHFSWEKIGQEYTRAYRHSKAILVPFDSIIAKNSFQRAV